MADKSGSGIEPIGLDVFGKACVSAGIVKTLTELVKLHPPPRSYPKEVHMTQYAALASLRHLLAATNATDRHTLIDQMLAYGMYDVLMEVSTFNRPSPRTHFT